MQKEELQIQKRLIELSTVSYQRNIATYSDFLNLNELNILRISPKELFSSAYETYGGYDYAERQMVVFLPDAFSCIKIYPIKILRIRPIQKKFSEKLSHRDYLGAILNLGVERSKIGDIIVLEYEAFVFLNDSIAAFVNDFLTRIRHTNVYTEFAVPENFSYTPKYEEIKGTVASIRLDSLLSLAYPMSRSKMTTFISSGRVFVNSRLTTANSYKLGEGDVISVRGLGKFMYYKFISETKKGRFYVSIHKYV